MPERYWEATEAVPPLSIAAMATGAYAVTAVGLNVTKRMRLIIPTVLAAAIVAVGLYFLLIPLYGFVGAGVGNRRRALVGVDLRGFVSHRIYPVPWEWRRVGLAVGVTPRPWPSPRSPWTPGALRRSLPGAGGDHARLSGGAAPRGFPTAAERRRLTGARDAAEAAILGRCAR